MLYSLFEKSKTEQVWLLTGDLAQIHSFFNKRRIRGNIQAQCEEWRTQGNAIRNATAAEVELYDKAKALQS